VTGSTVGSPAGPRLYYVSEGSKEQPKARTEFGGFKITDADICRGEEVVSQEKGMNCGVWRAYFAGLEARTGAASRDQGIMSPDREHG
jgi:hypothetical protein